MKKGSSVKKVIMALLILLCIFGTTISFFYIRFMKLDTYKWNNEEDIISFGDKQYKYENLGAPPDIKLVKQIGKIEGESSFRIWEIKDEDPEERIALRGFMFPAITYGRIRE